MKLEERTLLLGHSRPVAGAKDCSKDAGNDLVLLPALNFLIMKQINLGQIQWLLIEKTQDTSKTFRIARIILKMNSGGERFSFVTIGIN